MTAPYNLGPAAAYSVLNNPHGLFFPDDGGYFYVVTDDHDVSRFVLTVPWDVSTIASFSKSGSIFTNSRQPSDVFISPDGVNMFITGMYAGNIAHYTLSTPWSLETLVYVRKKVINPGGTSSPRCLYFTPDGTKLFVGYYSGGVAMFLLPTPWDINSISLAAAVVVHDPDVTARAYSIWISPDGGKLYLYSDYSNKLFIGTMATPWDLSTVSWVMDADMGPDGVLGVTGYYPYNGIFCNPSESRLFVTGTNSGAAIFTLFGSVPAGRFWTNFKNLREEA